MNFKEYVTIAEAGPMMGGMPGMAPGMGAMPGMGGMNPMAGGMGGMPGMGPGGPGMGAGMGPGGPAAGGLGAGGPSQQVAPKEIKSKNIWAALEKVVDKDKINDIEGKKEESPETPDYKMLRK